MLKWIGGCLILLVVVIGCVFWFSYKNLKSLADKGPTTSIGISAKPHRLFASIADADSLPSWRAEGSAIVSNRHGPLKVGDTVRVDMKRGAQGSSFIWIVRALVPDVVIAFESQNAKAGMTMFTRRDSLVASGDSTIFITTFGAPMMDSVRAVKGGSTAGSMMGMASNMMVGAMRMQADIELKALKEHIEGRVIPDSLSRPPQ